MTDYQHVCVVWMQMFYTVEPLITDTSNKERKSYSPNRLHTVPDKSLDELQLTYTSCNGQNLNSPAVSVIRGSTVFSQLKKKHIPEAMLSKA